MYSLPAHTVHLVLQYISPLTEPIPPHLISTTLRQRHHFLDISPSSPVEYLCWPSPDNAKTIELLHRLSLLFDQTSYPTRYTSDPESIFAHVQISDSNAEGLRMLFHWDDIHGWRYHDLRLMPFPPSSVSIPQESLASSSDPSRPPSLDLVAEPDHVSSDSDDSYWGAYGTTEHDLTYPLPSQGHSKPDTAEGEDAYWARYASVQGSADSTQTSPLSINHRLRAVNSHDDRSALPPPNEQLIDIPAHTINPLPLVSRPGPPSPNMLAQLLTTISPRKDVCSPVHDDPYSLQSSSAYSIDPSPEQTLADSELVTPPLPHEYLNTSVVSPDIVDVSGISPVGCYLRPLGEAEDKALSDSIKGLFYLWKAGRKEELEEKDKGLFLRIVQAAIARE